MWKKDLLYKCIYVMVKVIAYAGKYKTWRSVMAGHTTFTARMVLPSFRPAWSTKHAAIRYVWSDWWCFSFGSLQETSQSFTVMRAVSIPCAVFSYLQQCSQLEDVISVIIVFFYKLRLMQETLLCGKAKLNSLCILSVFPI